NPHVVLSLGDCARKSWSIDAPPATWSSCPSLRSSGTPVMSATVPPSWVLFPAVPDRLAATRFKPSITTILGLSGAKGDKGPLSVKSSAVVVGSHWLYTQPRGWCTMSRRAGGGAPCAEASMLRKRGTSSDDAPRPRKNERRARR